MTIELTRSEIQQAIEAYLSGVHGIELEGHSPVLNFWSNEKQGEKKKCDVDTVSVFLPKGKRE